MVYHKGVNSLLILNGYTEAKDTGAMIENRGVLIFNLGSKVWTMTITDTRVDSNIPRIKVWDSSTI